MSNYIDAPFYEEPKYLNPKNLFQRKLAELYNNEDALRVLESSEDVPVALKEIYVPLRLSEQEVLTIKSTHDVDKIDGDYIENILPKYHYVSLSGMPGSGKSTLTKYLITALADTTPNETVKKLGRRLVIPIILREMDFSSINSLDDLWEYWLKEMNSRLKINIEWDVFNHYIAQGWAIIIFDGLDELGEQTNIKLMDWINNRLSGIVNNKIFNTQTYVVITARPTGFLKDSDYSMFEKFHIQPFNSNQIESFVKKFFSIRYRHDQRLCDEKIENFMDKLSKFAGLVELKHRPIYLSMLGYISEVDGELPQTRALAYSRMIEAYVHQLDLQKNLDERKGGFPQPTWSRTDRITLLEELAYEIHTKADKEREESSVDNQKQMQIQISLEELKNYFSIILLNNNFQTINSKDPNIADSLSKYFLARTGLLIEPKEGFIQFSHLSFQEYLVASRIYRKQKKRGYEEYLRTEIFDKLNRTGWAEIAQLYFSIDSLRQGEEQDQTLHFVINPDKESHIAFLFNLFLLVDHKISAENVEKWLKTILFLWVIHPFHFDLLLSYKNFFSEIEKRYPTLYGNILNYLIHCCSRVLKNQSIFEKNELINVVDIDDKADLANQLSGFNQDNETCLMNILLLSFTNEFLKQNVLKEESLRTFESKIFSLDLLFILDAYYPLYPHLQDDMKKILFRNMSLKVYMTNIGIHINNILPSPDYPIFFAALETNAAIFRSLIFSRIIKQNTKPSDKSDYENGIKSITVCRSNIEKLSIPFIEASPIYYFDKYEDDRLSIFSFLKLFYNEKANEIINILVKLMAISSLSNDEQKILFDFYNKIKNTPLEHDYPQENYDNSKKQNQNKYNFFQKLQIINFKALFFLLSQKAKDLISHTMTANDFLSLKNLYFQPENYFSITYPKMKKKEIQELVTWFKNEEELKNLVSFSILETPYSSLEESEAKKDFFDSFQGFTESLNEKNIFNPRRTIRYKDI